MASQASVVSDLSKPSFHAVVFQRKTGIATYTGSDGSYLDDLVSLTFKNVLKGENLEDSIKKRFDLKVDPNAEFEDFNICYWDQDIFPESALRATKVFINLHLPPLPDADFRKWSVARVKDRFDLYLIPCIGGGCIKWFPNMNPDESAFNVHIGLGSYSANQYLCSSTPANQLYLRSK
jgi:hypothetical protein